MDHWDPALVNPIAAARPVLLIDNAGVGKSEGEVPRTYAGWTKHYIDVIKGLGFGSVDVLGYSMGGCVAQMLALDGKGLVRRLVLCGTTPSTGEGVKRAPTGPFNQLKDAVTEEEHRAAFLEAFFEPSETSQAAGRASWDRIAKSRPNRLPHVGAAGSRSQGIAFVKFMDPKLAKDASYNRYNELQLPVLIVNGKCFRRRPHAASPC